MHLVNACYNVTSFWLLFYFVHCAKAVGLTSTEGFFSLAITQSKQVMLSVECHCVSVCSVCVTSILLDKLSMDFREILVLTLTAFLLNMNNFFVCRSEKTDGVTFGRRTGRSRYHQFTTVSWHSTNSPRLGRYMLLTY